MVGQKAHGSNRDKLNARLNLCGLCLVLSIFRIHFFVSPTAPAS
jgi:hypothetical protein